VSGVNKALADDGEGDGVLSREIRSFREKQAKAERQRREKEEEAERQRREREEEEERRERKRKERLEYEFSEREKEWLEHERERRIELAKFSQDMQERRAKRKREVLHDDEDDKVRRRTIRSRENRRKRLKEKEEDDRERQHEDYLEEIKRNEIKRKLEEEEQRRIEEEREKLNEKIKKEQEERWQRGSPINERKIKDENKFSDKEKTSFKLIDPSIKNESPLKQIKQESESNSKPTKQLFSVSLKINNKRNVSEDTKQLGFSDEPEEDPIVPTKRRLPSLDSDMALKNKQDTNSSLSNSLAHSIIDQIPVERDELFSWSIDWSVVDKNNIVEGKMRPWVTKKIVEFLGEEEPTLIEYICKKLTDHNPPQEILDQLQLVLDDEGSSFVIKMWRMLIYNILMLSRQ